MFGTRVAFPIHADDPKPWAWKYSRALRLICSHDAIECGGDAVGVSKPV